LGLFDPSPLLPPASLRRDEGGVLEEEEEEEDKDKDDGEAGALEMLFASLSRPPCQLFLALTRVKVDPAPEQKKNQKKKTHTKTYSLD